MWRLGFVVLLLPSGVWAQTPPKFKIQDLGSLPNLPACMGIGISQAGLATGYCGTTSGAIASGVPTRGFLYSNGTMKDLGPGPQPEVVGTVVNDAGVVAGFYFRGDISGPHLVGAFIYQNGALQSCPSSLAGFGAFGITNSGLLSGLIITGPGVGFIQWTSGQAVVVSLTGNQITNLPPPPGKAGAGAFGLSPKGTWVAGGAYSLSDSTIWPVLWQNGTVQLQPLLSGFASAVATSTNDAGMATGAAFTINQQLDYDPNGTAHAVVFNKGAVTDLGVLPGDKSSMGVWINNSGWVVGSSIPVPPPVQLQLATVVGAPSPNYHAFLYANGTMYDLNKLLVNGTGWQLSFATMINDAGQIVGTGLYQGQQRAFLLTPVPPNPVQITSIEVDGGGTDIAQNTWIAVKGTGLAPSDVGPNGMIWSNAPEFQSGKMPAQLDNVSVKVNNKPGYIYYVSPTQVNVLTPLDSTTGSVQVQLTNGANTSDPFTVNLKAVAPAFLPVGATKYIVAQHLDYSLVGPASMSVPGYTFTPAHPGETIILWADGFGLPVTTLTDGSATQSGSLPNPPVMTIGGAPATVGFAGVVAPGLYQFNVTVPSTATNGDNAVTASYGGFTAPAGALITVQK